MADPTKVPGEPKNVELGLDELDAVTGGDNFKGYAEVNVLGLTLAVGETKDGKVEGGVFSGSGQLLGPVQTSPK